MANVHWKTGASGNWGTGSDWNTGSAPGAGDIVTISAAGTYTVTVAAAAAAYSLLLSNAAATLDVDANLALSNGFTDTQSAVDIAAGTLSVAAGHLTLGTNTYVYNASYGATIDGPGVFSTGAKSTTTIVSGPVGEPYSPYWELQLGGSVDWSNSGTVLDSGAILIGDGNGGNATINNAAGAKFEFLSPYSNVWINSGGGNGDFINAGTLLENSSGITSFGATLENTGEIDLRSGTLNLSADAMIGGTVVGSGMLEISAGATTLTAATSSNLRVAGGALILASAAALTGSVSETSGSIAVDASGPVSQVIKNAFSDTQGSIAIAGGTTLTVSGRTVTLGTNNYVYNASFGPTLNGSGSFITSNVTTTTILSGPVNEPYSPYWELLMGGGVAWTNNGTVLDSGAILVGDNGGGGASITNAAGATFEFLSPYSNIWNNTNGGNGDFMNAGKLVEDSGGSTTNFAATLESTGTIDLQAGTLNLQNVSTIGGTLAGAGVLEIGGGSTTLDALTSANLWVNGGALVLASASAITGSVSEATGSIAVDSAGPASQIINASLSDTQGNIAIAGGTTLTVAGPTLTLGTNNYVYNASYGARIKGPGSFVTSATTTTTIVGGPVGEPYSPYWEVALSGNVSWTNNGTVRDSGAILVGDETGGSAGITNAAGATFEFLTPYSNIWISNGSSGSAFSNAGTIIEANGIGDITSFGMALNNTGTIALQSGILNLQSGGVIGGTITGTGGALQLSGGVFTVTAAIESNLQVTGGSVTLDTASTISGNLTNSGAVLQIAGTTTLTGVVIDQSGSILITGSTLAGSAVTINGGATLSGYGTISAPVIDNGVVTANGGLLALAGGASGAGVVDIGAASKLEFLGSSAVATLSFVSGGAETLLLQQPGAVTGSIAGFGATDTIDLLKTAATKLAYANGTLTVTGASGTLATLDFGGSYVQANFGLQSDGKGGENIVFEPVAQTIADLLPPGLHPAAAQPGSAFAAESQQVWASAGVPDMRDLATLFDQHIHLG